MPHSILSPWGVAYSKAMANFMIVILRGCVVSESKRNFFKEEIAKFLIDYLDMSLLQLKRELH